MSLRSLSPCSLLNDPQTACRWRLIAASYVTPPKYANCCNENKRLITRFWRHEPMPRITRLSEPCPLDVSPYLQHVEEAQFSQRPLSACKPPHSLRKLLLMVNEVGALEESVLLPQLTELALLVRDMALQPGSLPQSLVTLVSHLLFVSQVVDPSYPCRYPASEAAATGAHMATLTSRRRSARIPHQIGSAAATRPSHTTSLPASLSAHSQHND